MSKLSRRRGLGAGKGKGYKNIISTDPVVHSRAAKGLKTYENPISKRLAHTSKSIKPFQIIHSHFRLEKTPKGYSLSLGNFTDAGWYWSGNENDLNTFLIRIANSDFRDTFLSHFRKQKIDWNLFKKDVEKAIRTNTDGIYALSGDNVMWHFGQNPYVENEEIFARDELETQGFNENDIDKIIGDTYLNYNTDFNEFFNEYKNTLKKDMLNTLKKSETLEDYFSKLVEVEETARELVIAYIAEKFRDAFNKSLEEFNIQQR